MSREWLKEFSVLVKAPGRYHCTRCVVKRQKAPTLEKAQELVANYGAYHRKKRGLVSEEAFSVIKNPVKFRVTYTFSWPDVNATREKRHALTAVLEAAKSLVVVDQYYAGTDVCDTDICIYRINITGDACMRSFIENQLRFSQKENAIIDYCIQVEPYLGDDICNHYMIFKTFNDKFFVG